MPLLESGNGEIGDEDCIAVEVDRHGVLAGISGCIWDIPVSYTHLTLPTMAVV